MSIQQMIKTAKGLILVKTLVGCLVASGWVLWATNQHTLFEMEKQSRQFEELNQVLLNDMQTFQEETVLSFNSNLKMQALARKNHLLEEEMQKMRYQYQKQIKDILAAEKLYAKNTSETQTRIEHETRAVSLGTLSVTGLGAVFREKEIFPDELSGD